MFFFNTDSSKKNKFMFLSKSFQALGDSGDNSSCFMAIQESKQLGYMAYQYATD